MHHKTPKTFTEEIRKSYIKVAILLHWKIFILIFSFFRNPAQYSTTNSFNHENILSALQCTAHENCGAPGNTPCAHTHTHTHSFSNQVGRCTAHWGAGRTLRFGAETQLSKERGGYSLFHGLPTTGRASAKTNKRAAPLLCLPSPVGQSGSPRASCKSELSKLPRKLHTSPMPATSTGQICAWTSFFRGSVQVPWGTGEKTALSDTYIHLHRSSAKRVELRVLGEKMGVTVSWGLLSQHAIKCTV